MYVDLDEVVYEMNTNGSNIPLKIIVISFDWIVKQLEEQRFILFML